MDTAVLRAISVLWVTAIIVVIAMVSLLRRRRKLKDSEIATANPTDPPEEPTP